ncbi:MAG: hypothetical protein ACF8R7_13290 [Phycisphaerales bacterium JB039]
MTSWLVAGSVLVAPLALGQDEPELKTMIAWEHQGASAWFPSEKDAGLVRAGSMVPDRLREIFELDELEEMREHVPWPLVELAISRLSGPMRFIVTQKGFDPNTGAPQVGAIMSFHLPGGMEEAVRMHGAVERLRAESGFDMEMQPSQRFAGMNEMQLPFGKLAYGPRQAADGHRYEIHFGAVPDPDAVFEQLPQGERGMEVVARGVLDFAAAAPFTNMARGFIGMLGEQGQMIESQLTSQGMLGEDAIAVEYTSGFTQTHGVESLRVRRAAQYAEGLGLTQKTITRADLQAIPADASMVWVGKADTAQQMERTLAQIEPALQAQGMSLEEVFEQIESQMGVDVPALIESLGDTWMFYLSDSTGGGGFLSSAMLVKLTDTGEVRQTLTQLSGMFNHIVAEEIDTDAFGVTLSQFEHDGVSYTQLRTPGLPAPMSPTLAVTGEWLVAGLTAQSAAGAVRQLERGGAGLADNASFKAEKIDYSGATSLIFVDAPRTIRDGYPWMGMVTTALANAVRSPHTQRDPGLILPPYAELVAGARPLVMTSFWDGDDYVTQWTGDRSTLVNAAGVLGVGDLGSFIGGAIVGAGMTGGAMQEQMRNQSWEPIHDDDPDF